MVETAQWQEKDHVNPKESIRNYDRNSQRQEQDRAHK